MMEEAYLAEFEYQQILHEEREQVKELMNSLSEFNYEN
jgi:hypothetical protein